MKLYAFLIAALFVSIVNPTLLCAEETPMQFEERTAWWQQSRFGLLVILGPFSVAADARDLEGNLTRFPEIFWFNKQIPLEQYVRLAQRFSPTNFNAAQWVREFKQAGAEYVVLPAKSFDGFSMYDTKLSDFSIVRASPFKRDFLREMTDECRKQGLRVGLFYTMLDAHHPDYLPRQPWDTRSTDRASMSNYISFVKGQLRELLTQYGHISFLFFEGAFLDAEELRCAEINQLVRELQPHLVINNGNKLPEDLMTLEEFMDGRSIPTTRLWARGIPFNDAWAYATNAVKWQPIPTLLRLVSQTVADGGHVYFGIGAKPDGSIPSETLERLRTVGAWMKRHDVIFNRPGKNPFRKLHFEGTCSMRGNSLILHVFDWPAKGITLHGLQNEIISAKIIDTGEDLKLSRTSKSELDNAIFTTILPPKRKDAFVTVAELQLQSPVNVIDTDAERPDKDGVLVLNAKDAEANAPNGFPEFRYSPTRDCIEGWTQWNHEAGWYCAFPEAAVYSVKLVYSSTNKVSNTAVFGDEANTLEASIKPTSSRDSFGTLDLGQIPFAAGRQRLSLRPSQIEKDTSLMDLRQVRLTFVRKSALDK